MYLPYLYYSIVQYVIQYIHSQYYIQYNTSIIIDEPGVGAAGRRAGGHQAWDCCYHYVHDHYHYHYYYHH